MQIITVATKDVLAIVRAADPSYRKRQCRIVPSATVTLHDLNWSGGTRAEYTTIDLATGLRIADTAKYSALAPWRNPAEGASLPIPEGIVVVQTGHFCGKVATAWIYVNPANLAKLLPAA